MTVVPKVVVIGAGFGGLEVARGLKGAPVEVTLVDQHNFHTFQPLLYQVATAGLSPTDVAHVVRGLFHRQANVRFRRGRVTCVDWTTRTVTLDESPDLPFDHLVLAAGATVTWFGTPGAEDHAFPLYTLDDATRLRSHVLQRFEAADRDPTELDRGGLTFVVVGGGPTGVETAGALAELFAMVFRKDYPSLDLARARVVLIEMQDHLLHPFTASSRRHALDTLRSRGVEVRLGAQVESVSEHAVTLVGGEVLPTQTLVWAAGVQANPLAAALDLPQGRGGRVTVARDLQVPGRPGAWVVGDVAAAVDRHGDVLPQLAPVAMQSGRHVARQIRRRLEGRPTAPFRYRDKGTMATIGRRAAVAELPGRIHLRGGLAWIAWLGLHLVTLVGHRNRASVLINWAWNYLTWDRGPRLITEPPDAARGIPETGVLRTDTVRRHAR